MLVLILSDSIPSGNFGPINAPAATGAIATGDSLGDGVANTGASNQATGATGGNLPSGAVAGSGGNSQASGNAADARGNASLEMIEGKTTGPINDECPVPLRRDEFGEKGQEQLLPSPVGYIGRLTGTIVEVSKGFKP